MRNRLTGISGFNTDCSPLTASFKYDALNRRIEKSINGVTIKYLYDGVDIIQELNQDGSVKANYIRGLNIDEPLARIKADGTVRYYQQDVLGSVIALTDENGVVKTMYSYEPFGAVTITGEASDNPFQFMGIENDDMGLYYYHEKYYNSELQRFISENFVGDGSNYYLFAGNNPVSFKVSYGLFFIKIPGGVWKWIIKKTFSKVITKTIDDGDLDNPYERDDDGDEIPNFRDPDSEYCQVNCQQKPPKQCH